MLQRHSAQGPAFQGHKGKRDALARGVRFILKPKHRHDCTCSVELLFMPRFEERCCKKRAS